MPLPELARAVQKAVLARTTLDDAGAKRVGMDSLGSDFLGPNVRDALAFLYSRLPSKWEHGGLGVVEYGLTTTNRLKFTGGGWWISVPRSVSSTGWLDVPMPTSVLDENNVERVDANGIRIEAWDSLYLYHTKGTANDSPKTWRIYSQSTTAAKWVEVAADPNAHYFGGVENDADANRYFNLRNGGHARHGTSLSLATGPIGYATENLRGTVQLSDNTQAENGSDNARAITAQHLHAALNSRNYKVDCRLRTTANITLSGLQTIDGVATAGENRILVMNQTNQAENGIYLARAAAWVRTFDLDSANDFKYGVTVFVREGSAANAKRRYNLTSTPTITLGTTAIVFEAEPTTGGAAAAASTTWLETCRVDTGLTPITLSGEQTIDSVACVTGDRILVRGQATASQNGIWVVSTGAWTRATDFDATVKRGAVVPIAEGSSASIFFKLTTANPITIGTSSISFSRYIPTATTGVPGVVELADSSEALALTDTTRAMTPAQTGTVLNNQLWKEPCRTTSSSNVTLSGHQSLHGVTTVDGDRVLLRNQTNGVENGIWLAQTGAWTRPADFNGANQARRGTMFLVQEGWDKQILYRLDTTGTITIGTTSLGINAYTPTGNTSNAGMLEVADDSEAIAATDNVRAITSKGVKLQGDTRAWKEPCRVRGAVNLTLSGEQTVDGIACVTGDRVLLTSQTDGTQNGPWIVSTGAWTRPTDFDSSSNVKRGMIFTIHEGGSSPILFRLTTPGTITVGTTALAFSRLIDLGSTSSAGVLRRADAAEARAQTNDDAAMTPLNVLHAMNTRAQKTDVRVRTTANIALTNVTTAVDGVTLVTGDRVLVMNQTAPAENGIYSASTTGAWTRATDADHADEFKNGVTVRVREGTPFNIGRLYYMNSTTTITLGTTAITFTTDPTGSVVSTSLDFGSIAAGRTLDLTVAVTGAAVNDLVVLGPPALAAGLIANAHVSAADTVTVRISNLTAAAIDPAAQTYKVMVIKQ